MSDERVFKNGKPLDRTVGTTDVHLRGLPLVAPRRKKVRVTRPGTTAPRRRSSRVEVSRVWIPKKRDRTLEVMRLVCR